jgi:hypothetical protein
MNKEIEKDEPEIVEVLRTCDKNLKSYGGFQWPESGEVIAPDWKPTTEIGNGLHGLLEGNGDWRLLDWSIDAKAMIVKTDKRKIVDLGNKVKFQSCVIERILSLAEGLCYFITDKFVKNQIDSILKEAEAASGEYNQLAASGNNSRLATSGEYNQLATSGNNSRLATSGNNSQLAASGEYNQLAASGNNSQLAASGKYSQLAASGKYSQLAASGNNSQLAASGNNSRLAASGKYSQFAASGKYSQFAASGNNSRLAASGEYNQLATSGNNNQLAASGNNSIVVSSGYNSIAKVGENGAIALAYMDENNRPRIAVGYVGEDGIEAEIWYKVVDGKLTKV